MEPCTQKFRGSCPLESFNPSGLIWDPPKWTPDYLYPKYPWKFQATQPNDISRSIRCMMLNLNVCCMFVTFVPSIVSSPCFSTLNRSRCLASVVMRRCFPLIRTLGNDGNFCPQKRAREHILEAFKLIWLQKKSCIPYLQLQSLAAHWK